MHIEISNPPSQELLWLRERNRVLEARNLELETDNLFLKSYQLFKKNTLNITLNISKKK